MALNIYYDPNKLNFPTIAAGSTSMLQSAIYNFEITNNNTDTFAIDGGGSSPYTFRETGTTPWLTTGSLTVSNLWKTETETTSAVYVDIVRYGGYFYVAKWVDGTSLVVTKTDDDGTVLHTSASLNALARPIMRVVDSTVYVAHTDAGGTVAYVSSLLAEDLSAGLSSAFLDGTITASTIVDMHVGTFHLETDASYITVVGTTNHATNTEAVGIWLARGLTGLDIYHGTTAHLSVASSSAVSEDAIIICGQDVAGSKFTVLNYYFNAFYTGVDFCMDHSWDGDKPYTIVSDDLRSTFYPVVTDTDVGLGVMDLQPRTGGYSTNIELLYSDPILVDNSNTLTVDLSFTGVISDVADTTIANFKDGVTTNYILYCKSTGELALKTGGGTEVWTTTDLLKDAIAEGTGTSSGHRIRISRGLSAAGLPVWAVDGGETTMSVSVTNSQASLDFGDRVELPITGVYSNITVQFGAIAGVMRFQNESDIDEVSAGSTSSTVTLSSTLVQRDFTYKYTSIHQQSGYARSILVDNDTLYITGESLLVGRGRILRHPIDSDFSARVTPSFLIPSLSQCAGIAVYDDKVFASYMDSVNTDIASIGTVTTQFQPYLLTSIDIMFSPGVEGYYVDVFSVSPYSSEEAFLRLSGYAASTIDLGNTPYGLVTFEVGHRDYYSLQGATSTQAISTYSEGAGDYVYDHNKAAFIQVTAGEGEYVKTDSTVDLQDALANYDAYLDTINIFTDPSATKSLDDTEVQAIVKFAVSLMKAKLYFAPDSNYTFDELSNFWDLGEDDETGIIPDTYSADNDPTYYIASKQIEIKETALDGRIEKAVKFRIAAYLGDSGEERYDDFAIFNLNLLPSGNFNLGDSDA
jgi:hypothetical protein